MKKIEEKTNVMRILEQKNVTFQSHIYTDLPVVNGMEIASVLNEDPNQVFKTLVTVGKSGEHYVFVLPVNRELDLKKAANAAHEKNIEMIKQKELLPLTGYIHGGCSPIGMKKLFKTIVDEQAILFDTIMFSAGKIGYQVELNPQDIESIIPISFADICKDV